MTFFGYFVLAVSLFSLYIGYGIFDKILKKKGETKGEPGILEKGLGLLFICLLMISINSLTMILSYTYFWEKTYRTITEEQYEAVVIGYEKETIKVQNFRNSGYDDEVVFFPKVKYKDVDGKEVIKTVDITDNEPPAIGTSLKITDKESKESANATEVDGIMFIFGCIFTGLGAFFTCLLSTYATQYTFKRRIRLSVYCGLAMLVLNIVCIILIGMKQ